VTDPAGSPATAAAGHRRVTGPAVDWHDSREIAASAATALLLERAGTSLADETLPLGHAIGRVLARDVLALCDVPHYASSAMDGWAVTGTGPWQLVPASEGDGFALPPGRAVAIVTGGALPHGADAVLRSESGEVRRVAGGWRLESRTGEPHHRQHVRPPGEEALAGDRVILAGRRLNPAHIALAAGCGHDELVVAGRPRIALLLTGDEVVERGIPAPGRVRDSFGPQLATVLGMLGGIVTSERRVPDDLASTVAALRDDTRDADVIVTTGGTGGSPADHIRAALEEIGAAALVERVAMRPGVVSLGAPLLAALARRPSPATGTLPAAADLDGRAGSSILVPYRVVDGRAVPNSWLGSGMMRGLADADGVLVVPPPGVRAGESVETLALPWT
jgi:molybdopterin molybdotransferase